MTPKNVETGKETMTMQEMIDYCKTQAKKWWNLEFDVPLSVNNRLKVCCGRFKHFKNGEKSHIEIAGQIMKYAKKTTIEKILLHELTHWALFKLRKPWSDTDYMFQSEIIRVGALKYIKYCGEAYEIICCCCNKSLGNVSTETKAKNRMIGYKSNCCKSGLKYKMKILEDTNT